MNLIDQFVKLIERLDPTKLDEENYRNCFHFFEVYLLIMNQKFIIEYLQNRRRNSLAVFFWTQKLKKMKNKNFESFKILKISRFRLQKFNIQNSREFLNSQRDEKKVWIYLSALFQPSLKLQKNLLWEIHLQVFSELSELISSKKWKS